MANLLIRDPFLAAPFRLMDEFEMKTTGAEARKRYGHAANFTGTATSAPAAPIVRPQVAQQTELF